MRGEGGRERECSDEGPGESEREGESGKGRARKREEDQRVELSFSGFGHPAPDACHSCHACATAAARRPHLAHHHRHRDGDLRRIVERHLRGFAASAGSRHPVSGTHSNQRLIMHGCIACPWLCVCVCMCVRARVCARAREREREQHRDSGHDFSRLVAAGLAATSNRQQ